MAQHAHRYRDSKALAIAALATLVLGFVPERTDAPARDSAALDGLVAASTARNTGAELLGDAGATARLSFAPDLDRLVWRVTADDREVLLDATTGEPLAFEFD